MPTGIYERTEKYKKESSERRLKYFLSEKGKETKRKISVEGKGRIPWNKGLKGTQTSNRTSFKKGNTPWNKNKKCPEIAGDKNPSKRPEVREKLRLKMIEHIQTIKGYMPVNIGKHEKQILDEIELSNNIIIARQYSVCGYFVDGYCEELNIVFEIDESFHRRRKEKDTFRQMEITKKLKCKFMRIDDDY